MRTHSLPVLTIEQFSNLFFYISEKAIYPDKRNFQGVTSFSRHNGTKNQGLAAFFFHYFFYLFFCVFTCNLQVTCVE